MNTYLEGDDTMQHIRPTGFILRMSQNHNTVFTLDDYRLAICFFPTTKGVDPGLRSFRASAMVMLDGVA